MELFEIQGAKVVPLGATLLIKEFKSIWDLDKSKDKSLAVQELGYVYYSADYKSIYQSTAPEEREQQIIEDIFGPKSKWTPSKEVLRACEKYRQIQVVPTMRLLNSGLEALEQLIVFLRRKDTLSITDKSGKPIYKPKDLTSALSETAKVADSMEKLNEKVMRELAAKGTVRGKGELEIYEEPEN